MNGISLVASLWLRSFLGRLLCTRRAAHHRSPAMDWRIPRDEIPFSELVTAWEKLLSVGWCVLGGVLFCVDGREVREVVAKLKGSGARVVTWLDLSVRLLDQKTNFL